MLRGGCQCGNVRYEITGEPVDRYICHCRECQAQSASAFGISILVKSGDLRLISGSTSVWTRAATIRGALDCHFCPNCGTRLWHGNPARDAVISVKGGSLDEKPDLSGLRHIWVKRKLRGVVIPEGCETWPGAPGDTKE